MATSYIDAVLAAFEAHGVVLLSDDRRPAVAQLVAGEAIAGRGGDTRAATRSSTSRTSSRRTRTR